MSMTERHTDMVAAERANYGAFADAVGGIATVVLAILGLSGVLPETILGIVTIIFGVALLIEGGAMLSEYGNLVMPASDSITMDQFGGGGLSAIFLAGAAGIVLGVLALLGIHATILTAAAVIGFGGGLVLSSNSVASLHALKTSDWAAAPRSGHDVLAAKMSFGSAGVQAIAGLSAIVLGILAIAGRSPASLSLIALLVLGAALILAGTTSGAVLGFVRHGSRRTAAAE